MPGANIFCRVSISTAAPKPDSEASPNKSFVLERHGEWSEFADEFIGLSSPRKEAEPLAQTNTR
jgi:hypothetical protein